MDKEQNFKDADALCEFAVENKFILEEFNKGVKSGALLDKNDNLRFIGMWYQTEDDFKTKLY